MVTGKLATSLDPSNKPLGRVCVSEANLLVAFALPELSSSIAAITLELSRATSITGVCAALP
jgi:hypothetical protein